MRLITFIFIMLALIASTIVSFGQNITVRWTSEMNVKLIHGSDTVSNDTTVSKLYALEVKPGRTYHIYEYVTALLSPNPIRVQAPLFAQQSGTIPSGAILGGIDKTDWIKYAVTLTTAYTKIVYKYAMSDTQGGGVEFRTGSITGPVFASMLLPVTGSWSSFVEIEIQIPTPVSASEVFVTFTNSPRTTGSGGNIEWIEFR